MARKKPSPHDIDERRKLCDLVKDALQDLKRSQFYRQEKINGIKKLIEELKELETEMGIKATKWQTFADQLQLIIKKHKVLKRKRLKKIVPVKREKEEMPELMVT